MPTSQVPPEVLEDIFSQLSSSKSALYNLSLSCKTFYHICKPFLYSHVTITTGEQRRKLKEVRKEDAQLVKKLVIKGENSSRKEVQMDGKDNLIGSGIIEDLFVGNLLDISVIKVLHVSFLYEDVDEQPNCETLEFKAASNLVELSIQYHFGGGSLWEHVLGDNLLCPSLARFGSCNIRFFKPCKDQQFRLRYPRFVGKSGDYELVPISLCHRSLGQRLEIVASESVGKVWTELAGKTLYICTFPTLEDFRGVVPWEPSETPKVHMMLRQSLDSSNGGRWRQMLAPLRRIPARTPSFLSVPFSRFDLTPECLLTVSSIEDLGIQVHFALDEDEEASISLIPQSFVKFIEKQNKLEAEKEKEEEGKEEEGI
ncbi:hypothetical protein JCM5350_004511 [Sporobolomyces pararoseus]